MARITRDLPRQQPPSITEILERHCLARMYDRHATEFSVIIIGLIAGGVAGFSRYPRVIDTNPLGSGIIVFVLCVIAGCLGWCAFDWFREAARLRK